MKQKEPVANSVLEINFSRLKNNILSFKKHLNSGTKIMLMFKAEAYGTEASELAKLVEKEHLVDYLAVANLEEGMRLRSKGIRIPILLLNPTISDWEIMVKNCIEPEIHALDTLIAFEEFLYDQAEQPSQYPVHIHINTGMNHIGIEPDEIPKLIKLIKGAKAWKVGSIMSHLSSSDLPEEDTYTDSQFKLFDTISTNIKTHIDYPVLRHILNSNGLERFPEQQHEMVRLGIGIQGASELTPLKEKLKPITRMITTICAIRKVKEGGTIGYSREGVVKKDSYIATIPIGYADGFSRVMANGKWQVEIDGKLYPTIGNVCMDLSMIDLGNDFYPIGTEVTVFGDQLDIFDFAKAQSVITYEAMTRIGSRVKRQIVLD